jgi:hypothetical protein
MVWYSGSYYHTLDREYELFGLARNKGAGQKLSEPLLRVDQIGTSVAEGREGGGRFRQTVVAAMSRGVREIELGLSPSNVMSGPASYTETEKQELRELARINNVRYTSTHVSPASVGNLSGLAQNGSGFSEPERQRVLNEIKQAINFAAETALGGAVVVHTGEFPRSFSKFEKQGLMEFTGEAGKPGAASKQRVHHFVDEKTGEVIHSVREDLKNYEYYYVGADGKREKDKNKAQLDQAHQPILYKENGNYVTYEKTWADYEEDARLKGLSPDKVPRLFFEDTLRTAEEKARSQVKDFESRYEKEKVRAGYYFDMIKSLKDRLTVVPENMRSDVYDQMREFLVETRSIHHAQSLSNKDAESMLNLFEETTKKEMESMHEAIMVNSRKLKDLEDVKLRTKPISEYAFGKSISSLAELGITAMQETENAKANPSLKGEKIDPVFIAPENIFPEMGYGSHPEELAKLVTDARIEMTKQLKNSGWNESDAKKAAERHIRATFDTEHLGMWKKHFVQKPGQSREDYDKAFNKWYIEQVDTLAKSGVLGHVHLADGFGAGHANLPPGSGILPIKDAVKALKEKGYGGTFESEGYGDPLNQETGAWNYFGSPIYAAGSRSYTTFDKMYQSYFGSLSPNIEVTPSYYPSEQWKVWTGVPLD